MRLMQGRGPYSASWHCNVHGQLLRPSGGLCSFTKRLDEPQILHVHLRIASDISGQIDKITKWSDYSPPTQAPHGPLTQY